MLENIHAENINTEDESTVNKTMLTLDLDLNQGDHSLSQVDPQPNNYTLVTDDDTGDLSVIDGNNKVLVTIKTDDLEGETRTICLTIPKDDTPGSEHKATISLTLS